jgi:hypothetical protein
MVRYADLIKYHVSHTQSTSRGSRKSRNTKPSSASTTAPGRSSFRLSTSKSPSFLIAWKRKARSLLADGTARLLLFRSLACYLLLRRFRYRFLDPARWRLMCSCRDVRVIVFSKNLDLLLALWGLILGGILLHISHTSASALFFDILGRYFHL